MKNKKETTEYATVKNIIRSCATITATMEKMIKNCGIVDAQQCFRIGIAYALCLLPEKEEIEKIGFKLEIQNPIDRNNPIEKHSWAFSATFDKESLLQIIVQEKYDLKNEDTVQFLEKLGKWGINKLDEKRISTNNLYQIFFDAKKKVKQ